MGYWELYDNVLQGLYYNSDYYFLNDIGKSYMAHKITSSIFYKQKLDYEY